MAHSSVLPGKPGLPSGPWRLAARTSPPGGADPWSVPECRLDDPDDDQDHGDRQVAA